MCSEVDRVVSLSNLCHYGNDLFFILIFEKLTQSLDVFWQLSDSSSLCHVFWGSRQDSNPLFLLELPLLLKSGVEELFLFLRFLSLELSVGGEVPAH